MVEQPGRSTVQGPFGVVVDQSELYRRMEEADSFALFKLDGSPAPNGGLTIDEHGKAAGSMSGAHELDESLSASVLLENLACKASGALALEHLLGADGLAPEDVPYVIGCGEEAVGDRYQRGGGNLAKAIAEQAGCVNASGSDVKAFCCGPVHALVVAGSLVASGVYPCVVVVAGGSLAKLGMKFSGALRHGVPVLASAVPVAPTVDALRAGEIGSTMLWRRARSSSAARPSRRRDVHPARTGEGVANAVDATLETYGDLTVRGAASSSTSGARAASRASRRCRTIASRREGLAVPPRRQGQLDPRTA